MKTKLIIGAMLALCTISCSTPVEKRAKQCIKDGCTIVGLNEEKSAIFYYDKDALYFENVDKGDIYTVIDFHKHYSAHSFDAFLGKYSPDDFVKEWDIDDEEGTTISPNAGYHFCAYGDWAVGVHKDAEENVLRLFLVDKPNVLYVFNNEYKVNENEDIIITFRGSLLRYNHEHYFNDGGLASRVELPIDLGILNYWYNNREAFPMDIFDYEFDAKFGRTGKFEKENCYFVRFAGLNKTYTITELLNLKMLQEIKTIMEEKTSQYLYETIKKEAVTFDDIIDDFKGNPIKAHNTYTKGKQMYLYSKLEKITSTKWAGHKYCVVYTCFLHDHLRVYTKDENFANLDYPVYVYMSVVFDEFSKEGGLFTMEERCYDFKDGKLLFME